MFLALVGQKFGGGQSQTGGDDSFNGGIVCQVQEKTHVLHGAVFFEILLEEPSGFHVDTHSGEHDGEIVLVIVQNGFARHLDKTSLPTDLGSDFVVWQTGGGENGDFLTTGDGIHHVDGGDTGLDHFLWVDTRPGIDGLTLDVQEILSQNWGPLNNEKLARGAIMGQV